MPWSPVANSIPSFCQNLSHTLVTLVQQSIGSLKPQLNCTELALHPYLLDQVLNRAAATNHSPHTIQTHHTMLHSYQDICLV